MQFGERCSVIEEILTCVIARHRTTLHEQSGRREKERKCSMLFHEETLKCVKSHAPNLNEKIYIKLPVSFNP